MDTLVTGGLGFIGSNLALRLNDLGPNVTITDVSLKNIHRIKPKEKFFTIKENDITDYSQVERIVENIDIKFHLAAQTSHAYSFKTNLLTTIKEFANRKLEYSFMVNKF